MPHKRRPLAAFRVCATAAAFAAVARAGVETDRQPVLGFGANVSRRTTARVARGFFSLDPANVSL